jgi:CHASE3 domain sensor protein/putative methionine-R-sulfoxide reductase with GAF domain
MNEKFTLVRRIKERSIFISILFTAIVISINAGITMYNNRIIQQNNVLKEQSHEITLLTQKLFDNVELMDLGVRGYALVRDDGLLLPMRGGVASIGPTYEKLDSLLAIHEYDRDELRNVHAAITEYRDFMLHMVDLLKKDDMEEFRALLQQDKGLDLWRTYWAFSQKLLAHAAERNQQAREQYEWALTQNMLVQIVILLFSLPTLGFTVYRIRQDGRKRQNLFTELEENNRQYMFNPGTEAASVTEQELIASSIRNYKRAVEFISQVSAGNYSVDWEGMNEENKALNQTNLAGELLTMREQMKRSKEEDDKRMWATEGLTKFTEIIRNYQHDLAMLSQQAVTFIVKYLGAQQGGLFIRRGEEGQAYLELVACYAFNRKKFVEKRIEIGQGLVGQTYLEGQTVLLREIPQGYTSITSGLGDTTPDCLLIVPMRNNEEVVAVIEIAGFTRYQAYQISFIEKLGEIMASSLISAQSSEKTQILLEQTRIQAEQMQAQEEEMRQHMEEMQAAQEEMFRREAELKRLLEEKNTSPENT